MAKVDPRNFLLNTDYEMDKIIYFKEFEWTTSSVTTKQVTHGLPTVPLLFGVWSANADFSDSNEIGESNNPWEQDLQIQARSNMEKIIFTLTPKMVNNAYVSTTFYVKVFGFEPGTNWINTYYDGDVQVKVPLKMKGNKLAPTSKYAKTFIVNTDYNYLKLLKAGRLGEWTGTRTEYTHGLGYVPQILTWETVGPWGELGNNIEFLVGNGQFSYYSSSDPYNVGVLVDNDKIYKYTGTVPHEYEMRIYADEA